MAKIIKHWQEGDKEAGEVVYDYYLVRGIKRLMKGNQEARAIFGQFELAWNDLVVWSTYNGEKGEYYDECTDGEYCDDLRALRDGRVQFYRGEL